MFDKENLYADATAHQAKGVSSKWRMIFALLAVLGGVSFIMGIMSESPERAWQVYLVNFLYFTGLAQGMVVFAVILQMANARWGRVLKRLAELGAYFLPLSLVFLIILYFGRLHLFSWIEHPVPIPQKQTWLQFPFLFTRDFIGFLILAVLSFAFLKLSTSADGKDGVEIGKLTFAKSTKLAPAIVISYTLIYSLIAFDLIMSLDPHWFSTLFGGYYFITTFLSALCCLMVISVLAKKYLNMDQYITSNQTFDLGKLMFGFTVMSGYLFWSQFLPIWYGNLPEETVFVILRIRTKPWSYLAKFVFAFGFIIPFVLLLSQSLKRKPNLIITVAFITLIGLWGERFLLIAPSIWHEQSIPIGISEILISFGFLGIFGLVYLFAIQRHAILPINDPFMHEHLEGYPNH